MKSFFTVSIFATLLLAFGLTADAQPPTSNKVYFQNETNCDMEALAVLATIVPGAALNLPPDVNMPILICHFKWSTGFVTVPANSFITITAPVAAIGFVGGAIARPCDAADWAYAEVCTPDGNTAQYQDCCNGDKYGVDIVSNTVIISYYP